MGFMIDRKNISVGNCIALLAGLWPALAGAADVALVGLMTNKAMVVVDGGQRQTLVVGGPAADGVRLVSVESGAAVFEIDGKRRRMLIGQSVVSAAKAEKPSLVLSADGQGHFIAPGSINGQSMRFLVDTGATFISMGAADARRARIDTAKGTPGMTMTANGMARVWRVRLNNVKVGNITLHDVDASVHEHDMPIVLLGMSFLNRMEMRRDGTSLTLTQRY
ncbi:MAG: TIGR02281 family clan AA aspartic protease [Pseudomonadota bacterium]